jgi:hypothetical protein
MSLLIGHKYIGDRLRHAQKEHNHTMTYKIIKLIQSALSNQFLSLSLVD